MDCVWLSFKHLLMHLAQLICSLQYLMKLHFLNATLAESERNRDRDRGQRQGLREVNECVFGHKFGRP